MTEQTNPLWEDNSLQFPRLLCEIMANVGFSEDDYSWLESSMDLERSDIDELFDRAHVAWETAKGNR